ncbi:hypothetical protein Poly51_16960 [Rubripirellula tenax]|uniref:Uncharacterized protein n=1 Tax=Rubripirellula tenax TaxID=2528015 RepID=A0A5C6FFN6_9BACT|nr:hypothetical protein [Rubripirellula tenax]TWU58916.1 hypothetical protein Poly51_16960 [Rubripirellula tenax]
MLELLIELIGQIAVDVIIQGVFEMGGRAALKASKKAAQAEPGSNPWAWVVVYISLGAIAGVISVWIVPVHWIGSPTARLLNLAITPILLGFAFELLGRWKTKHQKRRYAVDRFSYGFTFALVMGLIRYFSIA